MAVTARRALSLRTWETRGIWGICQLSAMMIKLATLDKPHYILTIPEKSRSHEHSLICGRLKYHHRKQKVIPS